jgi:hypothetical protein
VKKNGRMNLNISATLRALCSRLITLNLAPLQVGLQCSFIGLFGTLFALTMLGAVYAVEV